ncbi:hypothetical protein [Rhizobium binxianense]
MITQIESLPLKNQEIAELRRQMGSASVVVPAVIFALILGGLILATGSIDTGTFFLILIVFGVAIAVIASVSADVNQLLEQDLAGGKKTVLTAAVVKLTSQVYRGTTSYYLSLDIQRGSSLPNRFQVKPAVYRGLKEGETIQIGYAPHSKLVLSVDTATIHYVAGDAE